MEKVTDFASTYFEANELHYREMTEAKTPTTGTEDDIARTLRFRWFIINKDNNLTISDRIEKGYSYKQIEYKEDIKQWVYVEDDKYNNYYKSYPKNNIFLIILFMVLFFTYAIKYKNCQDDIIAIIKQNNKTAKENFLLKKRFNLLTAEDLRPKG